MASEVKKVNEPPGHFDLDTFNTIIHRIRSGEGLIGICRDMGFHRGRFYEWLDISEKDDPPSCMLGLADRYARACELRAIAQAEELIDISDDAKKDIVVGDDGKISVDWEVVNRAKLRIDTRKWLMSKMLPKKYGTQDRSPIESGDYSIVIENSPDAD